MKLKACLSVLLLSCALAFVQTGTVKAETAFDDGGVSYASSSKTGFYIEPKIGIGFQKPHYGEGSSSTKTDFVWGLAAGYDFLASSSVPVRVEFEFNYNNEVTFHEDDGDLDLRTWFLLCNAYYDFHLTSYSLVPYLGLGIGIARSHAESSSSNRYIDGISGNETNFAFQLGGGCAFPITEEMSVDLSLRYLRVAGSVKPSNRYAFINIDAVSTFQVMAGLRYAF